jgi:hypothetical protein
MKASVVLSSVAHAAILSWGLVSFSSPQPLMVADVEALPIDIVPIEDVTRSVQGEKKADVSAKPAPVPTQKPQEIPDAVNAGDTDVDAKTRSAENQSESPTNRADAAPQAQEETQSPLVKPDPVSEPVQESEPVKTTEMAALSEPPSPIEEEPQPQASEPLPETAPEESVVLPDNVPVPVSRPNPPKPQTAETNDRRKPQDEARPQQTASSNQDSKSPVDEIAALLNKEKASAAGARRSGDQASLGTQRASNAERLSQSEMDVLRGAIERCWSVPAGLAGAEDMRVTIRMRLTQQGQIDGDPQVDATGGETAARRAFAGSARRAVLKCQPYNLPAEKYDTWAEVVVNFDPSQMF